MSHDRRFRFGVLAKDAHPGADFALLARRVEELGFSTLFFPDHFVEHPIAPIPAMAYAAAVTTTLRIGTLVLGNDYKHPVVLANEAATIDVLSGGRLELGVGAGWMTVDYEQAGIDLNSPRVRIERLDEALCVLEGLWADAPCQFEGEHYRISGLDGEPKPLQRPHPPLIVGGGGPRVLRVAAKHAQIVGINAQLHRGVADHPDTVKSLSAQATDRKLEHLRDAAGAHFDDLEIQTLTGFVYVTDDRIALARGMADAFGVEPEVALETPAALVGTVDEICADLEMRRNRWQMSYVVVPEEFVDAIAPVVERLTGT